MKKRGEYILINSFKSYHPFVNFYYFFCVIVFSMIFMHPVFLIISISTSFIYSIYLNGGKAVKFNILYMVPFLVFAALINPAFSHQGVTILGYFKTGNPITLESIVYGVAAAVMFTSVIFWFSCYNAVMTSDKFIYLFGRIIPGLSLIFSMVLRFVPKYKAQIKVISNAQKCIGRDVSNGNVFRRARNGVKIISIMITWALENAIETADSMKSRGYGLKGRTSFSNYRLDNRDKVALGMMIFFTIIILIGAYQGRNDMIYFPIMKILRVTPFSIFEYCCYFCLCLLPIIMEVREEIKWRSLELIN